MLSTDTEGLVSANDPRLERLLRAKEITRDDEIERLIAHVAKPVVSTILARFARSGTSVTPHDAEDIASTINLRLVVKLRALVAEKDEAVEDLERYVAVLAYNAVHDHLREAFPARARLKNRLRYSLLRDPRLALWQRGAKLCGGLAGWSGQNAASSVNIDDRGLTGAILDGERPADALVMLFRKCGHAAELEALVELFAKLWDVVDGQTSLPQTHEDKRAMPLRDLEHREVLRAVWREVKELRPMQRKALLLNLRSEETVNVIALFVLTGIATFEEVAAVLEWAPAQLADVWPSLPLDDLRIAELLGIKRQQVINLRKSARERLARRFA